MSKKFNNVNVTNAISKVSFRNSNNVNVKEDRYKKAAMIEHELVPKLAKILKSDEGSLEFLYKCFWKLPEWKIWHNAEIACKGRNPMALFIHLCKKDGI